MSKQIEQRVGPQSRNGVLVSVNRLLERFAHFVTMWVGCNWAFAIACTVTPGAVAAPS